MGDNKDNVMDGFPLSDVIRAVHDELILSQQRREKEGKDPLFYVDKLTIEASFIVTKSHEANAKMGIKLLSFLDMGVNANVAHENNTIHKMTLELTAKQPDSIKGIIIDSGNGSTPLPVFPFSNQKSKDGEPKIVLPIIPEKEK